MRCRRQAHKPAEAPRPLEVVCDDSVPGYTVQSHVLHGTSCWGMQVQHEPTTINHVHVDGRGWAFNLEDELHTRFTGASIDLMPIVLIRVAFADGDAYTWHKARPSSAGYAPGCSCSVRAVGQGQNRGREGGQPSCIWLL